MTQAERTRTLLLEVAGYLRLVTLGLAGKSEAAELIEKIGALVQDLDANPTG